LTIGPDALVRDAIVMIRQNDFSQLPVVAGNEVLGLFSFRSLARRLVDTRVASALEHEVEDFSDDPVFARVTDELHEILPALDRDGAVLVGDPDNLLAVVTPTDVTAYLFKVTRPFILLQEIELSLRSLIRDSCPREAIPERIRAAVASNYKGREDRIPDELERLSLHELVLVVLNRLGYEEFFLPVFGRNRGSVQENLGGLYEIRNAVLHFRRQPSEADLDQLVSSRAWLLRKIRRVSGLG
jgi:hypothetical protein